MSRQRWSLILILIFAVVLAACQPSVPPTPTTLPPDTVVPTTEPVVGETSEVPTAEATEIATEVVPEPTEAVTETAPVGEATEAATDVVMATEEATVEPTEVPTEEVTVPLGSVLEVAQQAGDFGTLLAAIDAAGLNETLTGSGPFTIFAPTDAAFSAMLGLAGIGTNDLLANENLGDILRYHIVAGDVTANDLEQYRTTDNPDAIIVPTLLAGKHLTITFSEAGGIIVNGVANVTVANVEAGNGIIHVIDAVLVPPVDEVATEEAPETVTEVMVTTEAPTEEATEVEEATEAPTEAVVMDEATEAAPVEEMPEVATEEATVEAAEVPTEEAAAEVGNVIEVAQQAGDFGTLLAAIDAAGLTDTLEGAGPFTIFAPTDEAFAALLETLDVDQAALLARPDIGSLLLYHVTVGTLSLEDLATFQNPENPDEFIVPTAEGESLIITIDADGVVWIDGVAKVTLANVVASNGVIYVIDTVLLPASFSAEAPE